MNLNMAWNKRNLAFRKIVSFVMVVTVSYSMIVPPSMAQQLLNLPLPGQAIWLTSVFQPPVLRGMTVHPENPLLFDFIVYRGQDKINNAALKDESTKLIKYFLTAMTIPDKDAWVNLSPYEKDRIIPDALGQTEMGRQMLEQDYILKQLSSSLTNPDKELGEKFWNEVKARAQKKFGATDIPLSTFNKVWIVPDGATVVEKDGFAYITESKLKVMLDEDYEALDKNTKQQTASDNANLAAQVNKLSSEVFREMILPQLIKEVNTGKNFMQTRQVFGSVILAAWYKKALKDSLLGRIYADKSKIAGVQSDVKDIKQKVYEQYLEAFKKGAYNVIKEEGGVDGDLIPRKYFSGGLVTSVDPNIERGSAAVIGAQRMLAAEESQDSLILAGAEEPTAADKITAEVAKKFPQQQPVQQQQAQDQRPISIAKNVINVREAQDLVSEALSEGQQVVLMGDVHYRDEQHALFAQAVEAMARQGIKFTVGLEIPEFIGEKINNGDSIEDIVEALNNFVVLRTNADAQKRGERTITKTLPHALSNFLKNKMLPLIRQYQLNVVGIDDMRSDYGSNIDLRMAQRLESISGPALAMVGSMHALKNAIPARMSKKTLTIKLGIEGTELDATGVRIFNTSDFDYLISRNAALSASAPVKEIDVSALQTLHVKSWGELEELKGNLKEKSIGIQRKISERGTMQLSDLLAWHKTRFVPKDGRLRPRSTSLRTTGRDTLHFSFNGNVHEQFMSSWIGSEFTILVPFNLIGLNAQVEGFMPADTWLTGDYVLPEGAIIFYHPKPGTSKQEAQAQYRELLKNAGKASVVNLSPFLSQFSALAENDSKKVEEIVNMIIKEYALGEGYFFAENSANNWSSSFHEGEEYRMVEQIKTLFDNLAKANGQQTERGNFESWRHYYDEQNALVRDQTPGIFTSLEKLKQTLENSGLWDEKKEDVLQEIKRKFFEEKQAGWDGQFYFFSKGSEYQNFSPQELAEFRGLLKEIGWYKMLADENGISEDEYTFSHDWLVVSEIPNPQQGSQPSQKQYVIKFFPFWSDPNGVRTMINQVTSNRNSDNPLLRTPDIYFKILAMRFMDELYQKTGLKTGLVDLLMKSDRISVSKLFYELGIVGDPNRVKEEEQIKRDLEEELFTEGRLYTPYSEDRIKVDERAVSSSGVNPVGGIDFDPTLLNLQIKRNGRGVPLPLPQQDLEHIDIKGLYPVIINILPINAQTVPILGQLNVEPEAVLSKG